MTQEVDVGGFERYGEERPRRASRLQRQRPPGRASLERNPGRVPLQPFKANSQKRAGSGILNLFKSSKRKTTETLPLALKTDHSHPHKGHHTPKRANTSSSLPTPRLTHRDSRKSVRPRAIDSEKPVLRTSTTWDPPPLFQAYPQSIKHGRLQASNLSADHILHLNRRRASLEQIGDVIAMEAQAGVYEANGKKGKHKRGVSGSISRAEWTEKIYVLVTSGYLLQYSSDGHHDRLPEKILQLNKDSVAFASDAIPGKHWVLQISRTADDDGALDLRHSKSLLSRFGFHSQEAKRTCKSFLLVMDSPEELDSWLATVRREIESLGSGKYFHPEADTAASNHVLTHRTSRTLLIKRDTMLPSNPAQPAVSNAFSSRMSYYSQDDRESFHQVTRAEGRDSLAGANMSDQRSTISDEAWHEPRDGRRQSVVSRSSGLTVSRSSVYISEPSTPPAIAIDHSTMPETKFPEMTAGSGTEIQDHRAFAVSTSERQSLATLPISEMSGLSYSAQSTSPITPNFSMPSFSKRFSAAVMSASPQPPQRTRTFSPQPCHVAEDLSDEAPVHAVEPTSSLGRLPDPSSGSQNTPSHAPISTPPQNSPGASVTIAPSVFPKRLSSLEYANGKFPAPSPPPNSALPTLPKGALHSPSALRRPVSMQLRPSYSVRPGPSSPVRPLSHYTSTSVLRETGHRMGQEGHDVSGLPSTRTAASVSTSQPQSNTLGHVASPPVGPVGPPPNLPLPEVPAPAIESSPRRKSFSSDGQGNRRRSMAAGEAKVSGGTNYELSRRSIVCS